MSCQSQWDTFIQKRDQAQQSKAGEDAAKTNAETKNQEKLAAEEAANQALTDLQAASQQHSDAVAEMNSAYQEYAKCMSG